MRPQEEAQRAVGLIGTATGSKVPTLQPLGQLGLGYWAGSGGGGL